MPALRTTPAALAAAALVVASTATLPLLAQSTSNMGGGPQTTSSCRGVVVAVALRSLTRLAVVFCGLLLGPVGVVFAHPLVVCLIVLVKQLCVDPHAPPPPDG